MEIRQRSLKYMVEREVLDEQKLEEVSQRKTYSDTHRPIRERIKGSINFFPILYWLPKYSIWDYGMPDLISGISVGIMHLPQGMAYALLASLPPVIGLYTSLYPALIYIFFGTSRHISIGTFTVLSIMVGSVTERLAPDENFFKTNGTNVTEVDTDARDSYRIQVAAATTVLGGLIQVVLGLVKFGFVGTYLSEPLVRAYTTAAAAHAVVAQLKYMFGVSPTRFSGPLALIYTLMDVCSQLPHTHLPTLVVSVVSMVLLIAMKELNSFLNPKLPVPIPGELITLSLTCLVLTDVACPPVCFSLSSPQVPNVSLFGEVISDAFALAIVGYAISISLGKTFALKHGYKVDSNQELVALGLSNTVGGFFQCYSVCPSMSRSLIQETTGGKTQMAGVASALIVLVTILKLGPLFQDLPKAVLSSIVFVNLKGMFKQHSDVVPLWRSSKIDLVVWIFTWVSTLLLNMDLGLAASIIFALLTVIFRTQMPTYSVLGNIPGTELYLDIETHREAREIPGITIFRSSSTVYFANAELYLEALKEKVCLGLILKRELRDERKGRQRERYCAEDRVSLGSLGKWTWDIHSIIIDLSTANFIDTVAIKTMKNIFKDFREIDVDVYIAGCQAPVVDQLEFGNFFSESVTKKHLFATVHDAVIYCLNHRGATSLPRYEPSAVSTASPASL
uniref:Solute carrier family 26 member 6, like 1 n=1 Tax=Takifugu rubripes TaxID=31033 RepID=A0A674NKD0_TAKRU